MSLRQGHGGYSRGLQRWPGALEQCAAEPAVSLLSLAGGGLRDMHLRWLEIGDLSAVAGSGGGALPHARFGPREAGRLHVEGHASEGIDTLVRRIQAVRLGRCTECG